MDRLNKNGIPSTTKTDDYMRNINLCNKNSLTRPSNYRLVVI